MLCINLVGVSLKQIFEDRANWVNYIIDRDLVIDPYVKQEVEKMMSCQDPEKGFRTYRCPNCDATKTLPFTCKSRICSSCGKKHADMWSEDLAERMFDVSHRHMVFTIPDILRDVIDTHRSLLRVLSDAVGNTMKLLINERRKHDTVIPGIISVLHPYGKGLNFNPHIHAIVTEGGLASDNTWVEVSYIPYAKLRKTWQKQVLEGVRKALRAEPGIDELVSKLYSLYPNGFYVNAKRKIEKQTKKKLVRYIGRYIRHPAVAESRIASYDGKTVIFWYEREGKRHYVTLDVMEFIDRVVHLIPPKNFKLIRYYGLYSRKNSKKSRDTLIKLGKLDPDAEYIAQERRRLGDMIICDYCHTKMEYIGFTIPPP